MIVYLQGRNFGLKSGVPIQKEMRRPWVPSRGEENGKEVTLIGMRIYMDLEANNNHRCYSNITTVLMLTYLRLCLLMYFIHGRLTLQSCHNLAIQLVCYVYFTVFCE